MSDQRSFLDRLLRRTEKIVPKKDDQGKIVGQTLFQYDKYGEIIAQTESLLDPTTQHFRKVKQKNYTRNPKGFYDPKETVYYDDKERPLTERIYTRDDTNMLCCSQRKYAYIGDKRVQVSYQQNTYDAGLWTTRHLEQVELDTEGGIVKRSVSEFSPELLKLVCVKEKAYEKNEKGEYDPVETLYRDMSDRITKRKKYHREQTIFDKDSVLIGKETKYGYSPEGAQQILDERKLYHKGLNYWGTMEELAADRFQTRLEKLSLVHVSKYMPKQEDGHWVIPSTAQATDFRIPRNRVHFTIGHHVASHNNGNWDESGIMIMAPFKGALELNGKPLGMSSVDTFFETKPDHPIILPQGTHIFMPAKFEAELGGSLSRTEGDITYYKTHHFSDREKKKIFDYFSESIQKDGEFTHMMNVSIGNDFIHVFENDLASMTDEICMIQNKRMLLDEHLRKNGYFTEADWQFSSYETDRNGCGLVAETGEKLGCRWADTGNKTDFNTDFFLRDDKIVPYYNQMQAMDFIMHLDDYQITGVQDRGNGDKVYEFKGPHYAKSVKTTRNPELEDGIARLKSGIDIQKVETELAQNAEEHIHPKDEYVLHWTPAFQETYTQWSQKVVQDLTEYMSLSQKFDFDGWQQKLDKKIADFEAGKSEPAKAIVPPTRDGGR